MTTVADIGERELIKRFSGLISVNESVVTGVGDDCSVDAFCIDI